MTSRDIYSDRAKKICHNKVKSMFNTCFIMFYSKDQFV